MDSKKQEFDLSEIDSKLIIDDEELNDFLKENLIIEIFFLNILKKDKFYLKNKFIENFKKVFDNFGFNHLKIDITKFEIQKDEGLFFLSISYNLYPCSFYIKDFKAYIKIFSTDYILDDLFSNNFIKITKEITKELSCFIFSHEDSFLVDIIEGNEIIEKKGIDLGFNNDFLNSIFFQMQDLSGKYKTYFISIEKKDQTILIPAIEKEDSFLITTRTCFHICKFEILEGKLIKK